MDTTIFDTNSSLQAIIIMAVLFGIAFTVSWVFGIKNWKPILVMYGIFLILAYAVSVLSMLYSTAGYVLIAIVVYSEYSSKGSVESE